VDAFGLLKCVSQDVVTRACNGKNDIFRGNLEKASIDARVFPSEGVDVFITELPVLLQLRVVVDSPMVLLVPSRGKR